MQTLSKLVRRKVTIFLFLKLAFAIIQGMMLPPFYFTGCKDLQSSARLFLGKIK